MKDMTPETAEALQKDLEIARQKLDRALARFWDCRQTEWTGGDSGDPKNYRVPAPSIHRVFAMAEDALVTLTMIDHELALWLALGGSPSQRGDEPGAEWFQKRFANEGGAHVQEDD